MPARRYEHVFVIPFDGKRVMLGITRPSYMTRDVVMPIYGSINKGETPIQACERWTAVMTGQKLGAVEKVMELIYDFKGATSDARVHIFLASPMAGKPLPTPLMGAHRWYHTGHGSNQLTDAAPYDSMPADFRHWLNEAIQRPKIFYRFMMDGPNMTTADMTHSATFTDLYGDGIPTVGVPRT